jgi:hypothetical protein
MALVVQCDGPDCLDSTDERATGWIEVEGADIHTLYFCTLLCCSRFMATSVAFHACHPALPFS